MLEETISYFKEQGYIDDNIYVERAINEFMALNTLSYIGNMKKKNIVVLMIFLLERKRK